MTEKKYTKESAPQESRQLEKEIKRYDKLILLKPDFAEAYYNRGLLFLQLSRLKEAIKSYDKAIQIKPGLAEAYNNRGIALQELGRLDLAVESYDKAIQIKPDYEGAYHNLGIALRELGQLEQSIVSCNQAIQIKPDYAEAYLNLGVSLQELGQPEKAIKNYGKAAQIKPDYAEAYLNLGVSLLDLGQLEQSIVSCKKAIQLNPNSKTAQHILNYLLGSDSQSAPEEYIKNLFNRNAQIYENRLLNELGYTVPSLFKNTLSNLGFLSNKFNKTIDLGCGTGLVGVELRNIVNTLIGIDLSEKMIRKAQEKNVYDELVVDDLIRGLETLKINFNLFVVADVFTYLGNLCPLFNSVNKYTKSSSLLIFSTEDVSGDSFFLRKTGRFAHSKNYILSMASNYGFQLEHFEKHPLRKDKGEWVAGGIYILRRV